MSKTQHVIYIGTKAIPLTLEQVPLEEVRLDADNPRLRHRVQSRFNGKKPTQEQLRSILVDLPAVGEMQANIRENGGLLVPIYIKDDGLVVEGNCRTAIFLTLSNTEKYKQDPTWKTIPAWRFPKAVDENDIAVFQAKHHITSGKNPWESYEKANHIFYMHNTLKMSVKEIAKELPLQERIAVRLLDAYTAMTRDLLGGGSKAKAGDVKAWSHYEELFKNKKLARFRDTPANLKKFASCIKSGRIGRAEHVRSLPDIVATPGAFETLQKKGFDEANRLTAKSDPTGGLPVFKVLAQARDALGKFEVREAGRIKKEQHKIVRELHRQLCEFAKQAGIKLEKHGS
jgi:hypothetical protein